MTLTFNVLMLCDRAVTSLSCDASMRIYIIRPFPGRSHVLPCCLVRPTRQGLISRSPGSSKPTVHSSIYNKMIPALVHQTLSLQRRDCGSCQVASQDRSRPCLQQMKMHVCLGAGLQKSTDSRQTRGTFSALSLRLCIRLGVLRSEGRLWLHGKSTCF
jgi:hypothetical protein